MTEHESALDLARRVLDRPHAGPNNLAMMARQFLRAVERETALRATVCAKPGVAQCAELWEADHQRRHLEHLGLAEEFPWGCDAIEHVAEALLAARRERDELRTAVEDLAQNPKTEATARVAFDLTPAMADELNRILEVTDLGSRAEVFRRAFTLLRIHVDTALCGRDIYVADPKSPIGKYIISLPFAVKTPSPGQESE